MKQANTLWGKSGCFNTVTLVSGL